VVRETATGKQSVVARVKNGLELFALSSDGKLVVTARKSDLGFFRVPDGKAAFPGVSTSDPIRALSDLFLDDTRIATLHENGVVRVWDLTAGKEADVLGTKSDKKGWNELHVTGDGVAMTVSNNNTGDRMMWDLKAKKQMPWEQKSKYSYAPPRYRPMSGGLVYFAGSEFPVKLKDGEAGRISCVALTDLATGAVTGRLLVPEDPGVWEQVRVSKDGKRVVMLNTDRARVYVWDVPGRKK
jgi:hypothetical protein